MVPKTTPSRVQCVVFAAGRISLHDPRVSEKQKQASPKLSFRDISSPLSSEICAKSVRIEVTMCGLLEMSIREQFIYCLQNVLSNNKFRKAYSRMIETSVCMIGSELCGCSVLCLGVFVLHDKQKVLYLTSMCNV